MGRRRAARELALQILFQVDVGKVSLEDAIAYSLGESGATAETLEFAEHLARCAVAHQKEIDEIITRFAEGWTLERMASVDRNILRIGLCEILHMKDIPPSVSINEAVEMAKIYSTEDSGKFVNGIMGNYVRSELGTPWTEEVETEVELPNGGTDS